jgi:hypothetical protein
MPVSAPNGGSGILSVDVVDNEIVYSFDSDVPSVAGSFIISLAFDVVATIPVVSTSAVAHLFIRGEPGTNIPASPSSTQLVFSAWHSPQVSQMIGPFSVDWAEVRHQWSQDGVERIGTGTAPFPFIPGDTVRLPAFLDITVAPDTLGVFDAVYSFRTLVPQPVPEPAPASQMGIGLAGLLLLNLRRRVRTSRPRRAAIGTVLVILAFAFAFAFAAPASAILPLYFSGQGGWEMRSDRQEVRIHSPTIIMDAIPGDYQPGWFIIHLEAWMVPCPATGFGYVVAEHHLNRVLRGGERIDSFYAFEPTDFPERAPSSLLVRMPSIGGAENAACFSYPRIPLRPLT